jgi:type IV pilus assembly protein PilV
MGSHQQSAQRGASLVEVLVAMVILAVGLLGLVGLQGRLHVLQMESYQRAQALILLTDMANRVALNRINANSYVSASTAGVGVGAACPVANTSRTERDIREWCLALQGAAETSGGSNVGAMVGGRGCIQRPDLNVDEYLITVAWQGLAPVSAPPASVDCGNTLYNGAAGSPCVGELCRRVVTTIVRISDLTP